MVTLVQDSTQLTLWYWSPYESVLYHVRNYYYLVIVVMWTYEDTSMYQTDKGCILISILGFQIEIEKEKLRSMHGVA